MTKENKRLLGIMLTAMLLLLIPLISMRFTDEMNWSPFDFLAAAVLLFGTGLLCELAIRKVSKIKFRIAIVVSLLMALLLVCAELAVGIFGTPFGGS